MNSKQNFKPAKIAIVGTASIFPGSLKSKTLWENVLNERDFITDVPPSHFLAEDYYDPNDKKGEKLYCKRGAFLSDIPFDPVEFGMPPNLLSTTDTVQLLSLVVARDVLNDTVSFQNGKTDRSKTGVILGVAGGTDLIGNMSSKLEYPVWKKVMREQGLPESKINIICDDIAKSYQVWNENTFPGLLVNVVAGRIANRFDLGGTNCTIDAACASSLGAIKMGIQELQLGTLDMVITGGSDALNNIFMFMCFNKTTALSPSQDCRPFSDKADGTLLGEGFAMMTLKRLEDAERDGDRIYAVIAGMGSSSDGKSKSIYAPTPQGQSLAIRRAYELAGHSADEVELVEAHGTGTKAGDAAEFSGLKMVYGDKGKKQRCAIGSIKSQIGHTKSSAGAASLLKASLALHHKILPPTIKIDKPNPLMDIENSPFYLNTKARPWIHDPKSQRRAGVSSMGFGGTNFHISVEDYNGPGAVAKKFYRAGKELILLAADSAKDIEKEILDLINTFQETNLEKYVREYQAKFKPAKKYRLAILLENSNDLKQLTDLILKKIKANPEEDFSIPNKAYFSSKPVHNEIAFLFSGQGSQYINMGSELVMQFDQARQPWDISAGLNITEKKLHEVVYPIPVFDEETRNRQREELVDTRWGQPAIGTLALSHLAMLAQAGIKSKANAGHSYGEIPALYASGVIGSIEDVLKISHKRGELMASASSEKGSMTAVFTSAAEVEKILKEGSISVAIANINSPKQVVISGREADIVQSENLIKGKGIKYQRLAVSTAFHSELVSPCAESFNTYLNEFTFSTPETPVYSNTSGSKYQGNVEGIYKTLANQLANPVRFEQIVKNMYESGIRVFVEIGPGTVLSKLVSEILPGNDYTVVSMDGGKNQNSKFSFWNAMARLSVAGINVDYNQLWQDFAEAETNEKKMSSVAVKLNGSSYGKMYPPKGGAAMLPKPNPELPEMEKNSILQAINPQTGTNIIPQPVENKKVVNPAPVQKTAIPGNGGSKAGIKEVSGNGFKPVTQQINNPVEKSESIPYTNKIINNEIRSNGKIMTNNPSEKRVSVSGQKPLNNGWFDAFQEIQKNALEAQKFFQQTIAESHKSFLNTSEMAMQQLANIVSGMSVRETRVISESPRNFSAPVQQEYKKQELISEPKQHKEIAQSFNDNNEIQKPVRETIFTENKKITETQVTKPIVPETVKIKDVKAEQKVSVPASVDIKQILLKIVSEKTGYPEEILELDTDLESGLGIDSIKRVEILSALQEDFPELKSANSAELAALNTLGEILAYSENVLPKASKVSVQDNSSTIEKETGTAHVNQGVSSTDVTQDIKKILLKIVSEKTGYPEEILELDTDLESGLGIDSIKRVEILSALQEDFPELKSANSAELAALNTLGEILAYSENVLPKASKVSAPVISSGGNGTEGSSAHSPLEVTASTGGTQDIKKILLKIVSEKTGYPEEILELDTDLESGLGIDSIKRVEILSALQEDFPELKSANSAELAALNTLGEIIAYSENVLPKSPGLSQNQPEAERLVKKNEKIFRYEVNKVLTPGPGIAVPGLNSAEKLYIIRDNRGIAGLLAEKLANINLPVEVVEDITPASNKVIFLKGLDKLSENDPITEAINLNYDAFKTARTMGTKLFKTGGLFITVHDSGVGTNDLLPWSSGLSALAKTAAIEWKNAFVKSIDIQSGESDIELAADLIFKELVYGGLETEVYLNNAGERFTYTTAAANVTNNSHPLKKNDVVIVSGGARGVTASCLLELAHRRALKFAILGRTAIVEEPAYLKDFHTDAELKKAILSFNKENGNKISPIELSNEVKDILAQREITANIEAIKATGSEVEYYSVDVSELSQVNKVIESVRDKWGGISGFVHAAGVLADKYIHEKSDDHFDKVFKTKVLGLRNILSALSGENLTHICCFSSVAARMGNSGQVDYAMANEILNKVCQSEQIKRKGKCTVKSINWGPWEGGMVSPELKKMFEGQGIALIPLDHGAEIFAAEMEDGSYQDVETVVGGKFDTWQQVNGDSAEKVIDIWVHSSNAPFLASHTIKGKVVVPLVMVNELLYRVAKSLYPGKEVVCTEKLNVLKGFQLDNFNEKGDWLRVICSEQGENGTKALKCSVESTAGKSYYKATLKLADHKTETLQKYKSSLANLEAWDWDKKTIYNNLFHGKDLEVITGLSGISENGCKGYIKAEKNFYKNSESWKTDVVLLDGGLQLACLWISKQTGSSSLPLGFESLKLHREAFYSETIQCELIVRKREELETILDIFYTNPENEILAEINGLRLYIYELAAKT